MAAKKAAVLIAICLFVFVCLCLLLPMHTSAGWSSKFCIVWDVWLAGKWVSCLHTEGLFSHKADIYLAPSPHQHGGTYGPTTQCWHPLLQLPLELDYNLRQSHFLTNFEVLLWPNISIRANEDVVGDDFMCSTQQGTWTIPPHFPESGNEK